MGGYVVFVRRRLAAEWETAMADRRGLGFIGWILGAITAAVVVITGVVVTVNVPQAATADVEISSVAR